MPLRHTLNLAAAVLLATAWPVAAQAADLLVDDFNTEHGGTGAAEYSGFAHFSAANVDLLAPGYFFHLCQRAGGSTACVDMEGSGNGALTSLQAFDLAPGTVTLRFDLAGDQRGAGNNGVTASLVSVFGETLFSETFTRAADAPFSTVSRSFDLTAATSARLRFLSVGPADSYGLLLDNVALSATAAAPVPEPSQALLLAGGLALGWLGARRRRTGA